MAIETPRYVHRARDGSVAKLVVDQAELDVALDDGWVIDPNTLAEPAPETTEPSADEPRRRGRPRKVA